jgi:hypothetical protein
MQPFEPHRKIADFEEALKAWGERPGKLTPAIAKTRVLASLPNQPRAFHWRHIAVAASLLVSIVIIVYLGVPTSFQPPIQVAEQPSIQTNSNVVIMVLDSQTTVYYILDSNNTPGGGS